MSASRVGGATSERRHARFRPALGRGVRMAGSGPSVISLVDADPDLADLLDARELERARREALTRVQRLSTGEWDAAAAHEPAEHHRGFLIVDGLLSRT